MLDLYVNTDYTGVSTGALTAPWKTHADCIANISTPLSDHVTVHLAGAVLSDVADAHYTGIDLGDFNIDVAGDSTTGIFDPNKYTVSPTSSWQTKLNSGANYSGLGRMYIHNLQFNCLGYASGSAISGWGDADVFANLIFDIGGVSTSYGRGINLAEANGKTGIVYNNVIYDCANGIYTNDYNVYHCYFNTISGCQQGINRKGSGSVVTAKCNILANCSTPIYNWQVGDVADYNVFDVGGSVGTNATEIADWVGVFIDLAGADYSLRSGSGVEGVATPIVGITVDIIGVVRDGVSPSAGAFEAAAGGGIIKTLSDSGGGIDSVVPPNVAVMAADIGTALDDSGGPGSAVTVSDSGGGNDAPPGVTFAAQVHDIAAAIDASGHSALLVINEAGQGAEVVGVTVSLLLGDQGLGSDLASILAASLKIVTDSATGTDQLNITTQIAVLDIATANDSPLVSVSVGLVDSATAVDVLALITDIIKTVADIARGSDALAIFAVPMVQDQSTGSDAASMTANPALQDQANGNDSATLNAATVVAEQGAGSDSAAASVAVALLDQSTGIDVPLLSVSLSIADTGSGADSLTTLQSIIKTVMDIGGGLDAVSLTVDIPITDTATGVDRTLLQASIAMIEAAGGSDIVITVPPDATLIAKIKFNLKTRKTLIHFH